MREIALRSCELTENELLLPRMSAAYVQELLQIQYCYQGFVTWRQPHNLKTTILAPLPYALSCHGAELAHPQAADQAYARHHNRHRMSLEIQMVQFPLREFIL